MSDYADFTAWLVIIILAANFVYLLRATKWYAVRKAFPLNAAGTGYENTRLSIGKANLCGHYVRNRVLSGIIKDGVVIKKPFPYATFMPPIFIPWNEIEHISIGYNIDGRPKTKMREMFSSTEYAKIELKKHKKFLIIIPWQQTYLDKLPKELATTS